MNRKDIDPTDIVVRSGIAADAPHIWRLFQRYQNWANVLHDVSQVMQFRVAESTYAYLIRAYPSVVATVDDTVVGFTLTEAREIKVAELVNIYVDDAFRRQGIGRLMLDELERQSHQLGISTIYGFSSEKYYPGKMLPTGIFERANWEVRDLGPDTQMYLRAVPLTDEEASLVWPTLGVAFPMDGREDVLTVDDLGRIHNQTMIELSDQDEPHTSGWK